MLISVILPVYNGAAFIAEALHSVCQQPHSALEIIVVDDGSTDGTAQIVRAFDVTYCYQTNAGAQAARNRGLSLATGDLLTFLDADDVWAADKLSVQLTLIEKYDVVVGHSQLMAGSEQPFLFLNLAAGLFRRRAFEQIGRFDPTLRTNDDLDWFMRLRESNLRLHVHEDVVLYHRRHADNLTRHESKRNQRDMLQMLHKSIQRRRVMGQLAQKQFGAHR